VLAEPPLGATPSTLSSVTARQATSGSSYSTPPLLCTTWGTRFRVPGGTHSVLWALPSAAVREGRGMSSSQPTGGMGGNITDRAHPAGRKVNCWHFKVHN
jgi:hypothetical protein